MIIYIYIFYFIYIYIDVFLHNIYIGLISECIYTTIYIYICISNHKVHVLSIMIGQVWSSQVGALVNSPEHPESGCKQSFKLLNIVYIYM